jgi:hypothetical protein
MMKIPMLIAVRGYAIARRDGDTNDDLAGNRRKR